MTLTGGEGGQEEATNPCGNTYRRSYIHPALHWSLGSRLGLARRGGPSLSALYWKSQRAVQAARPVAMIMMQNPMKAAMVT